MIVVMPRFKSQWRKKKKKKKGKNVYLQENKIDCSLHGCDIA